MLLTATHLTMGSDSCRPSRLRFCNQEPIPVSWFHAFLLSPLVCRLDELNLSWCYDFTEKHVQVAVAHVSETITQLNLSGYRKNLQRSGKPLPSRQPQQ